MARVTVEDCVEKVPNRFELVMVASQRSRDIANGAAIEVERDNDKNPVVSLREIADDKVNVSELQDELVRGMQRFIDSDEPEEDDDVQIFEQSMNFFDLCFQFLPAFVRRFTEHGYRSFEFTGSRLLKVDIVFFQQAVEIRDLGDNAN